jgi:hypothetical protein
MNWNQIWQELSFHVALKNTNFVVVKKKARIAREPIDHFTFMTLILKLCDLQELFPFKMGKEFPLRWAKSSLSCKVQ